VQLASKGLCYGESRWLVGSCQKSLNASPNKSGTLEDEGCAVYGGTPGEPHPGNPKTTSQATFYSTIRLRNTKTASGTVTSV
jgi:hypothetical protein